MKAAVTSGKGDIELAEAPMPETGEYRCLCRIEACATCSGTDVKIINGRIPFDIPYPSVFGHESVGKVVEKGSKARYISEGDVFLRPAAVYSGENLGGYFSSWGGFAEYGLVTDLRAFAEDNPGEEPVPYSKYQQKVPRDINPADAAMLPTLKEAASFISNAGVKVNSSVLILGSGPVAKSMCYFAKLSGAFPVIIAARRKEAIEWAAEAGADFTLNTLESGAAAGARGITGGGADFILDTTGSPGLVMSFLECLSSGGKAVPYATYPETDSFRAAGDKFLFTGPSEELAHEYLLYLLGKNLIDPSIFYTHVMPFNSIPEGFGLLEGKKAGKIVFTMEESP